MGVRVELARDSGVVRRMVQLLYLSFDFINISYLLYFSESALLSASVTLSSPSVQLEHRSCIL